MPLKHEIYGYFFYIFSKVFAEKYIKNILQEMKNGLSLGQQQLQVIMYRRTRTQPRPDPIPVHTGPYQFKYP